MGRQPTRNLQWIDDTLRRMPDGLYAHINTLDVLFSKLYYMDTPRDVLNIVLTLLKLRHRICNALGISLDPLPDTYYAPQLSATDTEAEERQLHEQMVREEEEYNRTYDERINQHSALTTQHSELTTQHSELPPQLPPQLQTTVATIALKRLQQAALLDDHYQPLKGVSNAEKGTIVAILAERLKLDGQWVMFGNLWGMNPATLRQAYNIGKTQKKTQKFAKNLKDVLR